MNKALVFFLWVFAITLVVLGASSNGGMNPTPTPTQTNCWDNYQTEDEAIEHCEEH